MRLAMQFQLKASEAGSRESLLRSQRRQLRSLLEHAQRTVPYYRRLFAAHGVSIPAELDPEFMRRVPVSTRAMIQQAAASLQSEKLPAEHGKTTLVTTSGSTGTPVTLLSTDVVKFFWYAFALRDHLWHRRDFNRKLCAIRWAPAGVAQPPAGLRSESWGDIVDAVCESGPSCVLNVAARLAEQIDRRSSYRRGPVSRTLCLDADFHRHDGSGQQEMVSTIS